MPEQAAPAADQIAPLLEALLFVADGPVEESALARALGVPRRQIEAPLAALAEALRERGLRLQRGPEGAQLVTAPVAAVYIEQFLGLESARRLSAAALETLAIIAYRQPVTRGTLEAIRGVNCDASLDTLRARGLVDIAGRAEGPGRPALFATTQKFLAYFGLERAEDLPALPPEVAELAAALPERAEQLVLDVMGLAAGVPTAMTATLVASLSGDAGPPQAQVETAIARGPAVRATGALAATPALPMAHSGLPAAGPSAFAPPLAALPGPLPGSSSPRLGS